MTNLIKVGAIAALATVGVIFSDVTASALETTPPAAPKITISTAQYKGEKNTIKFEGADEEILKRDCFDSYWDEDEDESFLN